MRRDQDEHDTIEPADALRCGPLWVSPEEMCETRVRGRAVPMSIAHRKMLATLIRTGGRVVSRDTLAEAAGAPLPREGSRSVDVQIHRIRRALGALGDLIVAVPRRGYRLDVTDLARLR